MGAERRITRGANYLPRSGEFVNILTQMFIQAKKRQYLKRLTLFLAALMFFGGMEGSTYATAASDQASLHNQTHALPLGAVDGVFAENGEERGTESDSDIYVTVALAHLPQTFFIHSYYSRPAPALQAWNIFSLHNSRAPPLL